MTKDKISTYKRYRVSPEGIILDTETGFEWLVGPDENTNWDEAKAWAKDLSIDGGGWRLPIVKELKRLCRKKGHNIDLVFQVSGWWIWAKEYDYDPDIFFKSLFDADNGCEQEAADSDFYRARVLSVRSAK